MPPAGRCGAENDRPRPRCRRARFRLTLSVPRANAAAERPSASTHSRPGLPGAWRSHVQSTPQARRALPPSSRPAHSIAAPCPAVRHSGSVWFSYASIWLLETYLSIAEVQDEPGVSHCEPPPQVAIAGAKSRQVVAIQVHHLVPGRHEVTHKRLLSIVARIDFRDGSKLGV